MCIPYIYYVYIIHIQTLHLSLVYTMHILCIYILCPCMIIWYCMNLFIAGFCCTYRSTAPPNLGLEDNRPDVHDEADFDIPDTQAVLERFMSNMSKLICPSWRMMSTSHYLTSLTVFQTLQVIPNIPLPKPFSDCWIKMERHVTGARTGYVFDGKYYVYTSYMHDIYHVYAMYIKEF